MKDFKKFLISTFFVIVSFLIIDQLGGWLFQKSKEFVLDKYPYANTLKVDYIVNKVNSDILIIGPSTASHHYDSRTISDSLGMSVYNCGIDGTYVVFETTLIRLIIDRYTPKIIIWELYEDALSKNLSERSEYQYLSLLYPYYSNNCYCEEMLKKTDQMNSFLLKSALYRNNSRLTDCIYPLIRANEFDFGYVPILPVEKYSPSFLSSKSDDNIADWRVALFEETLRLCKSKGIRLIFSSSPRYLNTDIKNTSQYKKYRELIEQYEYPFMDYYNAEPFASDATLFKDNNHMNTKGVELYMKQFIPKLKEIILNNE